MALLSKIFNLFIDILDRCSASVGAPAPTVFFRKVPLYPNFLRSVPTNFLLVKGNSFYHFSMILWCLN